MGSLLLYVAVFCAAFIDLMLQHNLFMKGEEHEREF